MSWLIVLLLFISPIREALPESTVYRYALYVSGSEQWAGEATEIAWCESRFRWWIVSDTADAGLMQINQVWWELYDYDLLVTSPLYNLQVAFELEQQYSWSIWGCEVSSVYLVPDDARVLRARELVEILKSGEMQSVANELEITTARIYSFLKDAGYTSVRSWTKTN